MFSFIFIYLFISALGTVPPPENVRMNSVNFKNILQWDSPAFPKGNLTFTAQYHRCVFEAFGRNLRKHGSSGLVAGLGHRKEAI